MRRAQHGTPAPDEVTWADRIRGCLLAGALGDAIGAPFEGGRPVSRERLERHVASAAPLRWTDDTALQLATAAYLASLRDWRAFDDDEHARALAHAWAKDPDRGYGSNPPSLFRTVLGGGDWRAAAAESFGGSGSLGNGGAMRAAPVGALPAPTDVLAGLARRTAAVTHAHPVGQDGAGLVAVAARLALHAGAPADAEAFVARCAEHVETTEVRDAVLAVPDAVAVADPAAAAEATGTGVAAHEAAPAALCAFLRHPREPLAAIGFAVRMGGDTDTIAAIAGSLSGAAAGARWLPGTLLDRLEDRPRIERVAADLSARTLPRRTPVQESATDQ